MFPRVSVLAAVVAAAAAIFSAPNATGQAQNAAVVDISSGFVLPAESITVSVNAAGVPSQGLAAVTVDVVFDPTLVDPVACTADPDHLFSLRSCNTSFSANSLRFAAIDIDGEAGDFRLANVTFQAIGAPGQSSPLDVNVVTFADPDGIDLAVVDQDGVIDILGPTTDSDGDLHPDLSEVVCGSDRSDAGSVPERVDTAGDDDGDGQFGEALPTGSGSYDCDGDGSTGGAEAYIFSAANTARDQDPCGTNGWPADLVDDILVPNGVSVLDLQDFVDPVRYMGSDVADWANQQPARRHDVLPGDPFSLGKDINILDLQVVAISQPPMLGGDLSFASTCPWAP